MGLITVGVSGDFTTLNAAIADGGTGSGDVIRTLADFTHDGLVVNVTKSGLSFESYSGDPADCVIDVNASKTVNCSNLLTDLSFTGMTFKNSKSSSTRYTMYALRCGVTLTDCVIEATAGSGTAYGMQYAGASTLVQRCHFKGNSALGYGYSNSLAFDATVDSCLFTDWPKYTVLVSAGDITIRNCTVYMPTGGATTARALYINTPGSSVYNTVIYGGAAGFGVDIGLFLKNDATNTAKNVISYGGQASDFTLGGSVVTANLTDQVAVTADGNPVFVALGTDFMPDTSGLAYHSGDAAFAPATDIDGNSFDSPPSIGCYEAPAAGGGTARAVASSGAGFLTSPFTLTP